MKKQIITFAISRLPLVALCVVAALCSRCSAPAQPDATRAAVVLLRPVLDDESGAIRYVPSCNGTAIGARLVETAAHCLPASGEQVALADRALWYDTASGYMLATVGATDGLVGFLRPDRDLAAWVPPGTPLTGPATWVHLKDTELVAEPTTLGAGRFTGAARPGDSGSGLYQGGALVGVVQACTDDGAGGCVPDSGEWGLP